MNVRRARTPAWLLVVIVSLIAIAGVVGCSDDESAVVGAQAAPVPSVYPLPPTTGTPTVGAVDAVSDAAAFVVTSDGVALPDPAITAGAVFADVQAIDICDLHYTQGIRQPRFNDKVEAFANYGISIRDRDVYQVDHLIPIALGGSNAPENLWPQPYEGPAGASQKDDLEQHLRGMVCSGQLALTDAQAAIAKDWWLALQTYMGPPVEAGTEAPSDGTEPDAVMNGGPCEEEGAIGYTDPKHVRLTCARNSYGELRWEKRY